MTVTVQIDPLQVFQGLFKQDKYRTQLQSLQATGKLAVTVEFTDIIAANTDLARKLQLEPYEYLPILSKAAMEQLHIEDPEYSEQLSEVNKRLIMRLIRLPDAEPLRGIGTEHLGKLIMIKGVVVRASPLKAHLVKAAWKCKKCGNINYVELHGQSNRHPDVCQIPDCLKAHTSWEFIEDPSESSYLDCQDLRLQERPEDLPPGQLPRTVAAKLVGNDLMNVARPGDHASMVCIPKVTTSIIQGASKIRDFDIEVDVVSVEVSGKELENTDISPAEEAEFKALAANPKIYDLVYNSIAPSIYGYPHIKAAIANLLFGGVAKQLEDINARGEINVLLVGDPGCAKSQLLRYVPKIAPRGLYTSGQGTSAAGLTAAVISDKKNGGFNLEAGALVLADRGVAAIDEMDKMNAEDRSRIHEAMEQHTVSIAKGGIVATLNARTAVLAACNPQYGRYEPNKNIVENINLPVTLLSRFDLIFVIRDIPNPEDDKRKSSHILSLHQHKSSPITAPLSTQKLRKYIAYARKTNPDLTTAAYEKLETFYLQMRAVSGEENASIAITARQLESLVRLAEAHARIALKPTVTAEDAEAAIDLMRKSLEQVGIDMNTNQIDIDQIMTGKPRSIREKLKVVVEAIITLENANGAADKSQLLELLYTRHKIPKAEAERLIYQLLRESSIYEPAEGKFKKA